ncbi:MAG: DNA polymerase III subunit alpha [Acidobacteriota bacterium]
MSFVHLHLHTQYSLLDGANRPEDLAATAERMGMPACAITDHGNMFGAVEFYNAMKSHGVKPIIGCEMYMALGSRFDKAGVEDQSADAGSNNHLIVLATNDAGYRNLVKLVSAGYTEGFYYKPRIDRELLREHREGLICLSSCLKGEVSQALANGNVEKARAAALAYREILGPENFFLEIQDHGIPDQQRIIEPMARLGAETGLELVATNDSHYLNKDDSFAHEVLLAIGTGKTLDDERRMKFFSSEFYVKSPEEMGLVFQKYPRAVANTLAIAERVNLKLEPKGHHLPKFPLPPGSDTVTYFEMVAREGLKRRLAAMAPLFARGRKKREVEAYRERLEQEIEIIKNMGFPGYFLVVWDFIKFAKDHGIPVGPGRGSAAGSLVAFSMDITNIDPLDYDLLFERFLNPERISMPDIDIDFCMNNRGRVIDYVRNKYGSDSVAQIITFGTMAARSVVRDVGRVLGHPYAYVDKIAKAIPSDIGIDLKTAARVSPILADAIQSDPGVARIVEIGARLEGLTRHAGVHAAGVVITPEPVSNYVPLYRTSNDEIVTQYDMRIVEKMGLLKMDFLGLRTLTVIDDALKSISAQEHEQVDIDAVSLEEPEVFRLFQEGRTKGVFQFESGGMVDLLRKARPTRFEDLAALNALYRPGALDAGMVDEYVRRKNGTSKAKYLVPVMTPILEETYGVIVYQEQVMQIAQAVAGYTLGQADLLRKAMGKKDKAAMEKERDRFVAGALARNYTPEKANAIFDYIEPFARYGFNKSHSVAYALVAYQTAWLKVHYPRHFMAALLTSEMGRTDNVVKFINEAAQIGIALLPPDINESNFSFTVVGSNIRFGLGAVKGVGSGAIESILAARARLGQFKSLYEFCETVDLRACNKKVIEALIKSGCFDSFGSSRRYLCESLESTADSAARTREQQERGQNSLFSFEGTAPSTGQSGLAAAGAARQEWPDDEKLRFEKETLGFYITGHPLNRFTEELKIFAGATTESLARHVDETVNIGGIVNQLKRSKIKKGPNEGRLMAKFVLDDQFGSVDVVVFSDLYEKSARWMENGVPVLLTAMVKDTGGVQGGRSAALAQAEQQARHIQDEYGGHPEETPAPALSAFSVRSEDTNLRFRTSGHAAQRAKPAAPTDADGSTDDEHSFYEVEDPEEEKTEADLERERIGSDVDKFNLSLFASPAPSPARPDSSDREDNGGAGVRLDVSLREVESLDEVRAALAVPPDDIDGDQQDEESSAVPEISDEPAPRGASATLSYDAPVTPELNALEITPLIGIRDRRVKVISLEIPYARAGEGSVKRLREIFEANRGEIPVHVKLTELPDHVAAAAGVEGGALTLKLNQHFRIQPGPAFIAAIEELHASLRYSF